MVWNKSNANHQLCHLPMTSCNGTKNWLKKLNFLEKKICSEFKIHKPLIRIAYFWYLIRKWCLYSSLVVYVKKGVSLYVCSKDDDFQKLYWKYASHVVYCNNNIIPRQASLSYVSGLTLGTIRYSWQWGENSKKRLQF